MGSIIAGAFGGPHTIQRDSEVIVKKPSDLAGQLDSNKFYFIDGKIDMGSQSIEVPVGGLFLGGTNLEVSRLTSSEENYKMFTSPVGGSGNLALAFCTFSVPGDGAQLLDVTAATGVEIFGMQNATFRNCTSLGELTGFFQGIELVTTRLFGKPTLKLSGTWTGGYRVDASLIRFADADMTTAFYQAGPGFTMASRFLSNANVDLPAGAALLDFAPANFPNSSTLLLDGMIVTREGVMNADDTGLTPNITEGALASNWRGNNGLPNTFVGARADITAEVETVINTVAVFETLLGTQTVSDEQHFDSPANGQLRHLGATPREFKITIDLTIEGTQSTLLTLRVKKWDDSASDFVTVQDISRPVNNLPGGNDVAFIPLSVNTILDKNDYLFLEIANVTGTQNVTAQIGGYFIVESR